ncbi:DUF1129 family protein [Sutcliffiella rhizosphaerae]|uniref:DUF1129 family protein n=1 Tax=Sutcliffiella rhizosphaerae TaxID=2880967 RepID=A0ABM8YLM5_9BACI|nr:DUF1129 family protein [Sutcliffiella rhizosphaerae]CAG9620639.1 hypothetical protein BACCIP111883_01408 [Sutcliffiella rhizosphaerae]
MKNTKRLIDENNQKRKLLNDENLELYEDFLTYIRTDFRVAEHEGEELLMELLDHMLEVQHEGRTAKDMFGDDPKAYAEEIIEGLPREKKRKTIPFFATILFNFFGFGAINIGIIYLVLSKFIDVKESISLSSLLTIFLPVLLTSAIGVKVIFSLIRSTLFQEKKSHKNAYWKAGLYGGGSFAIILLIAWLIPDFGPAVQIVWWINILIGLLLILLGKLLKRQFNTN